MSISSRDPRDGVDAPAPAEARGVSGFAASPPPASVTGAPHLPGLDGIRGLAILLVMFSHFIIVGGNLGDGTGPLERLLLSGYLGVDLFFVLSGFLITGILVDAKSRPHFFRTFYMRRALRIFPLYYGMLAVAYLSVPLLSPQDAAVLSGPNSPWWYWLYASNIGMAVKGTWLESPTWFSLGHFWSLAVEEQFYLVWPFVVFFLQLRWLAPLCALLVVSSPFLTGWLHLEIGALATYVSTLGRLGMLAAGGGLALIYRTRRGREKIGKWVLPVAAVSSVLLLLNRTVLPSLGMYEPLIMLVCGSAWVGLALECRRRGVAAVFFESRALRWLGKYSYGIYVYHHALKPLWIAFLWDRGIVPLAGTGWPATLLYTAAATFLSLSLAWLSWHLFEARILALKKHFPYLPKKA
jgi:peptidoglycan/LPS O-acetylase OafA/YrhL